MEIHSRTYTWEKAPENILQYKRGDSHARNLHNYLLYLIN
jgi:hypothetical protein